MFHGVHITLWNAKFGHGLRMSDYKTIDCFELHSSNWKLTLWV